MWWVSALIVLLLFLLVVGGCVAYAIHYSFPFNMDD